MKMKNLWDIGKAKFSGKLIALKVNIKGKIMSKNQRPKFPIHEAREKNKERK